MGLRFKRSPTLICDLGVLFPSRWDVSGQNLENYGVPADVYVDNTPADFLAGRDAQLEKAVQVLQEELKKNPPRTIPGR